MTREHPMATPGYAPSIDRTVVNASLSSAVYQDTRYEEVEGVLPSPDDKVAITPALGRVLARLVVGQRRSRILEFGAGSSSVVFARALSLIGGGRLTSVEQMPKWCAERWASVQGIASVDARMIQADPRLTFGRGGLYYAYDVDKDLLAARGPYDLVFIDAPQSFYGRDGSLHLAYENLAPGAVIVLDDAARPSERHAIERWLAIYPGLSLEVHDREFASRGIAVLAHSGDKSVRTSMKSIRTSVSDYRKRRVLRREGIRKLRELMAQ
jgi:predicted O-methyltransferase YrrM